MAEYPSPFAFERFGVSIDPPSSAAFHAEHPDLGPIVVSVPIAAALDAGDEISLRFKVADIIEKIEDVETRKREHAAAGPRRAQRANDVPVHPFREAARTLLSEGETLDSLARRAGYFRNKDGEMTPDAQRLKTTLGMSDEHKTWITTDTAITLAGALNLDPHELGF